MREPEGRAAGANAREPRPFGRPSERPLKAYAFDPSSGTLLGNRMSLPVRFEELDPGPVVSDLYAWDGVAVVDYDASRGVYYEPVDLNDPGVLIRGGLDPLESDPRFHQQMVYAVVTDTIQHFEAALGRRIHWYRAPRVAGRHARAEDIYTLCIYPHAMVSANAFYSRKAHGILFGYFRASTTDPGRNLPGQLVYTCLSHDIVVHETTHAVIDGIRGHFTELTNPDVAAFHEGFADIAALLRHFSHQEVLLDTIQRTGGMLFDPTLAPDAPQAGPGTPAGTPRRSNPLIELARQFGEATGRGKALRAALDTDPKDVNLHTTLEPHARGAILVAAVFDAFFRIYLARTADLFRIYRAGGAQVGADLPSSLALRLADVASKTARLFFTLCVRALDYCPPVDITFGDFLRALITSDFDIHPGDDLGLRDALMQAFRIRGIVPEGASFFSDSAIAWPRAQGLQHIPGLALGNPNGLTPDEQTHVRQVLDRYFADPAVRQAYAAQGLLDPAVPVEIPSFHPVFRIGEDGSLRTEMVIEVLQSCEAHFVADAPALGTFPFRGGVTLIVGGPPLDVARRQHYEGTAYEPFGIVRYAIGKSLQGDAGALRQSRQRTHLQRLGLVEGRDAGRFMVDFAMTHGGA